jgi:hypothetical protein
MSTGRFSRRSTEAADDGMYPFSEMCELIGFPAVWAFDRAHADEGATRLNFHRARFRPPLFPSTFALCASAAD